MFTRFRSYHVNKQTHKQISLKTSISLRYAKPVENWIAAVDDGQLHVAGSYWFRSRLLTI